MFTPCFIEKEENVAGKVKQIVTEKIVPVIAELGYDVVDIEYKKESDGMNLTFYIDGDSGIAVEDCEKVSKVIDPLLDELNPTDDKPYILNVSSPGIDRPLTKPRDFERNIGKEIQITLFAKVNGEKVFKGTLESYTESEVTIENDGIKTTFSREKIAHIVPIIKF